MPAAFAHATPAQNFLVRGGSVAVATEVEAVEVVLVAVVGMTAAVVVVVVVVVAVEVILPEGRRVCPRDLDRGGI